MMFLLCACGGEPSQAPMELKLRTQEDADELSKTLSSLGYQTQEPPPVRIVLEGEATLLADLGYIGWPHPLDIELDGGGRLLSGDPLRVEGRRIFVHDLAFAGEHRNYSLTVEATESVRLSRLHIVDAPDDETGKRFRGGAIHLVAHGPAVQVDADHVSIIEAEGPYSVLLEAMGKGRYGAFSWRDGRFGACPAREVGGWPVASFTAKGTVRMRAQEGAGALFPDDWVRKGQADWTEVPYDESILRSWRAGP